MVQINFAQKQVNAKVVYYGPGMSGKTTNLEIVHQRAPDQNKGDLTSISTDGDRTLFFDFMPLDLGTVAGMRTCFQIYTVPGQVYYNSTRKLVLQGVDGVVFVADSSAAMREENFESLRNLEENLNEYGKSLATMPHVIQFNKRDLPDALPVEELNALYNLHNAPVFEAVAKSGQGVFPTLKALAASVLESIHSNNNAGGRSGAPAPSRAPAPARAPGAALPRPAAEVNSHAPVAMSAAATGGAQAAAASLPSLATRPMMAPPAMAPNPQPSHGGGSYGGMNQPAMNQAGLLTQTGFHAAPLGGPPSQAAPGGLHMSQRGQAAPARPTNVVQRPPARPKSTAPRQPSSGAGTPLEGTRFRPRNQTAQRNQPRATPARKHNAKEFNWMLAGLGAVVVGVLGWVVVTFF